MVFVAAGMGGGTGTGAAPIVARAAKEIGALTVAVVTKPLELEMRDQIADVGLKELTDEVDSLIAIPNQKLLEVLGREHSLLDAFKQANDVLLGAVRGISDIITQTGLVNVDFQDVKTVMSEKGTAMMGTGIANAKQGKRGSLCSCRKSIARRYKSRKRKRSSCQYHCWARYENG